MPRHDIAGHRSLTDLLQEIDSAFGTAAKAEPPDRRTRRVQLATVHKAKGLGWQQVYLLQPFDIPLPWVLQGGGWRARQERNIEYVAVTRSYNHLVFLRHLDFSFF